MFGFLGGLMPGRNVHGVDVYLAQWDRLTIPMLVGLVALWAAGLIATHPVTWKTLRGLYGMVPTFSGRFERRTVALVGALVGITFAVQSAHFSERWETARGHEYESIAIGIVDGYGFSFAPTARWLYLDDEPGADEYGATAWKEPFYPYFIASAFRLFGPRYGRLAVVIAQIGFLVITCLLIYHLGCRLFGPGVGVAAALTTILLIDFHYIVAIGMSVPAISGLLLAGGFLLLIRYSDDPGPRRAAWLGFYLGVAALTHAVLMVLVPIAALFVLLHSGTTWRKALKPALLVGLISTLTISPWTVRNYVQFGHLIPVQTGLGLFANVSNAYVAQSYLDGVDACGDGSPPTFVADGPFDAIGTLREGRNYRHTWVRGVACVAAANEDSYRQLNEHERDGLHKQQLLRFVARHPVEFVKLTFAKTTMLLFDVPISGRGSIPLATLGLLGMGLMARKPGMWVFPLVILAYAGPYALTSPIYYRYQAPIEPIYALFAVAALAVLLGRPIRRITTFVRSLEADPARGD